MAEHLLELFEDRTRKFADRTVSEREVEGRGPVRISYARFGRSARGVAWQLAGRGIRPGDRVGLISHNRPEWGISFFGILLAGGIVIPLDIRLKPGEVGNILARSRARVCVAGSEALEGLEESRRVAPALECVLSMDDPGFGPEREDSPSIPAPRPDDVAVIPFSSGTTGAPKGVMLSHRNLASNVDSMLERCPLEGGWRLLSVLPIHHMYELMGGFLAPFAIGATVHYLGAISPRAVSAALAEQKIRVCMGVPALLRLFHKNIFSRVEKLSPARRLLFRVLLRISRWGVDAGLRLGPWLFSSIRDKFGGDFRFFISGGAALDPHVQRDLIALGLEVLQGYGLTETSPVTNVNPPGKNKIGTVGPPIPRVEIRLDPVEGCGPGEGEVLVRGPNVMLGYYEDPEATAAVMENGWFRTGDIGRMDKDGYLTICGRSKNVVVSEAGKNIYPEEVEDELLKSPYIKEVCVLGRKSRKGGEEVFAAIVPDGDAIAGCGETGREAEIIAREVKGASSRLADYKRVQKYAILHEDLPKTTTLKVKRRELIGLLEKKGLW